MLSVAGAVGAAPAHAANYTYAVGAPTKSAALENCLAIQRTYSSSWTTITRSCYYTGRNGTTHWYLFEWRPRY